MVKTSLLKCYFGCVNEAPLHKFPQWKYPHKEKFNAWKAVLDEATQNKGNNYIFHCVRICGEHFENKFRSPSRRLTANAIPTLNLEPSTHSVNQEMEVDPQSRDVKIIVESTPHAQNQDMEVDPQSQNVKTKDTKKSFQPELDDTIKKLKKKVDQLKKKCGHKNKMIKLAQKLSTSKSFLKYVEKLPETIKIFTKLQLKYKKKPKGRRFTVEEKIMALTIHKQSPKAYKILKQMFVLPSKRLLQKILSSFTLKPGITSEVLKNLQEQVSKMPEEKKLVTLLFDEVALAPGVFYSPSLKEIVGFEDVGTIKNKTLADHALVFMIKGIKSKTKQPICFTFCRGNTKRGQLKELLVNIIRELRATGLKIVCTICDQHATNVAVVKELINETKNKYLEEGKVNNSKSFEIDGEKIFPLFDTPHLLKGVRNNFLHKNATFVQDGETKCAKWEHLKMLLDLDVGEDELRVVNKLTESHINKDKIPKMKVKHAAQVFSQRVSAVMRFSARHKLLPEEAKETADFLLIFDKLFDSFNGHSYQNVAKIYKCCLKKNSPHYKLWDELLPILESIKFQSVVRKNGCDVMKHESIPSIKNWIHNIHTFREMFDYLNENHKVINLITRNFNQDPLENFFSCIRSNGCRNINPDCNQFINAYKTLIINNYNSPHSPGANCEGDYNNAMQSYRNLLIENSSESQTVDFACDIDSLIDVIGQISNEIRNNDSLLHVETKKYVNGYVIKKSKSKFFKKCNVCERDLCRSEVDTESLNYEVDYTKKSLFHPNDQFCKLMNDIYFTIVACLREWPESPLIVSKIKMFVNIACDFGTITCTNHKDILVDFILNLSITLIMNSWCKGVNRLLNGKLSRFDRNDPIKMQAFDYSCKRRRK